MAKNSKNNTPQKYLNNMLVLPVVQHIAEDILKYNHWNRNDTTVLLTPDNGKGLIIT